MTRHLRITDPVHGQVPLCGKSMWDGLTWNPELNECWECAAIAGTSHISHPHLLTEEERNAH